VLRPRPEDATAFGQGCLEDTGAPEGAAGPESEVATSPDDALATVVDAARREVAVLGHGRVGTEHLLLAVVRVGGEVGRRVGALRARETPWPSGPPQRGGNGPFPSQH
jgi:hypothetical protein